MDPKDLLSDIFHIKDTIENRPLTIIKTRVCYNCHTSTKEKLLRCSACKYAYYCSRECQREDWSKHKIDCNKFKEVKSQQLGIMENLKKRDIIITHSDIYGYVVKVINTEEFLKLRTGMMWFVDCGKSSYEMYPQPTFNSFKNKALEISKGFGTELSLDGLIEREITRIPGPIIYWFDDIKFLCCRG